MDNNTGKLILSGVLVGVDMELHKEHCEAMRTQVHELFESQNKNPGGLLHAIDTFEMVPELIKRIEELEHKLYNKKPLNIQSYRLSTRQKRILEAIHTFIEGNGYSPSVRELGDIVGLKSSSTVHGHLERMQKKGLIEWDPSFPRTIRLAI